jgi:hypothetical protein
VSLLQLFVERMSAGSNGKIKPYNVITHARMDARIKNCKIAAQQCRDRIGGIGLLNDKPSTSNECIGGIGLLNDKPSISNECIRSIDGSPLTSGSFSFLSEESSCSGQSRSPIVMFQNGTAAVTDDPHWRDAG